MLVEWSRLGSPESEGDVRVPGLGIVGVTQDDIDTARELGGDPLFELHDVSTLRDRVKAYRLGQAVPGNVSPPEPTPEGLGAPRLARSGEPVFISSTFEDSQEHRRAVIDALTTLGVEVRGMENYGARKDPPKDVCLQEVRESEVYVGVFSTRYGSIDRDTGLSYTELEYREALRLDLDIRIYFPAPEWPVLTKHVDEGEAAAKLGALKQELRERHTHARFTTPESLAVQICRDLFPERPLPPRLAEGEAASVASPEVAIKSARDAWYFIPRTKDLSAQRLWVGCVLRFANQADRDGSIVHTELTTAVEGHGNVPMVIQPPPAHLERRNPLGVRPASYDWSVPVPVTPIPNANGIVEVRPSAPVDRSVFAVAQADVGADVGHVTIHIRCTDHKGHESSAEVQAECGHNPE